MKQYKFYYLAAGIFYILFLFISGCADNTHEIEQLVKSNPTLKLALTRTPGQTDSYRLKTLSQRKVTVEGPAKENAMDFQGGQTTDQIEIVFDCQVQSIDADGNALEKIIIRQLKYISEVRDDTVLDFDSSKDKDMNNALAALIGQSYTIEVTPSGQVTKIIDADKILGDIEDIPSNYEAALRLVSESNIKSRHTIPLPDANDNELTDGKTWSNVTSFNFGSMGSGAYKRIYKLEKIEKADENFYAIIEMNAIPSVKGANESGQEQSSRSAPPMTDIRQTYTGSMKMDVTSGTLLEYRENLVNEWIIVPQVSGREGPPSVLSMIATKSYDIEKIN